MQEAATFGLEVLHTNGDGSTPAATLFGEPVCADALFVAYTL